MATLRPLLVDQWIQDSATSACMRCKNQFTCWTRRHHCRYCGFVLCGTCSSKVISTLRACDLCYNKNFTEQRLNQFAISSPLLSRVEKVSVLVHSKKNLKKSKLTNETKIVPKHIPRERRVTESPRIVKSIQTLESRYGSPASSSLPKSVTSSPILSRTLAKQLTGAKPAGSTNSEKKIERDAMVIVDPFSTGAIVVAEFLSRGCKVIRVLSDEYPDHILNLVLEGVKLEYIATIAHKGEILTTVASITELKSKWNIIGCLPGCETGVELADTIAEAMGFRTNGTKMSECRRNKYLMNEQVRSDGTPAVIQQRASTIVEVESFLSRFGTGPIKVVIKPVASAGTDSVFVCRSGQEVRTRFEEIMKSTNILGKSNSEVVLQEFLEGKEYVIDTVSYNGIHKVTAIWEYEKKPCNGYDFVYFAERLRSGDGKIEQELIHYQKRVLTALGIKNGAGHGEVMYTPDGPRLVEVGARCHGAEGNWIPLANKVYNGINQVKVLVDTYLDMEAWATTPNFPVITKHFGLKIDLISRVQGTLKALPKLDDLPKTLPTFLKIDLDIKIGSPINPTIDCVTIPGSILLCGTDKVELESDYLRFREMEKQGFYIVE